ncbi:MAG TPA: glycosyltransferase family 4 protein [Mycobacteriales bacterium]|nr:glycosyltransferase family 4 protein [Mycobacteriales bacterium]
MSDRTLRLLLVVGEVTGGIARHVRVLAEQLPRLDVDVTLLGPAVSLAAIGPPPTDVATGIVPVGSIRHVATARKELRLAVGGIDLVHAHGIRAGVFAVAGRRPIGVPTPKPVVVTWHNAPLLEGAGGALQRAAMRYAASRADVTLGASPDLTIAARTAGARDARDTFVAAPPLSGPTRSREEVRASLGVGARPLVLAVGRLQAQKRLDVLIDAAARWGGLADGPLVLIAGSGPDEADLRARISATSAPVELLGARADIPDLLAAADVVALPSSWEARALVAQEALRAGVPLVTTPVGGLPDLVGDAAIFVPVGDSKALEEAVMRVVRDADLPGRMATAGRERAATWPTVAESIAALVATYRSVFEPS